MSKVTWDKRALLNIIVSKWLKVNNFTLFANNLSYSIGLYSKARRFHWCKTWPKLDNLRVKHLLSEESENTPPTQQQNRNPQVSPRLWNVHALPRVPVVKVVVFYTVLRDRNYFYCSRSGYDFWQVTVPVLVPAQYLGHEKHSFQKVFGKKSCLFT